MLVQRRVLALAIAVVAWGCSTSVATGPQPATDPPRAATPASGLAAGQAELVIFNISGWTLIPSDQEVTDNGKPLVSLPRKTYQAVRVAAGAHDLRLHGRKLPLNVAEGQRYFIVMGYRPERSAVLPLAGDPVVIQQISEEQARPLLGELTQVGSSR